MAATTAASLSTFAMIGGITIISSHLSARMNDDDRWYDVYHKYVIYDENYTPLIDKLMQNAKHAAITTPEVLSSSERVPAEKAVHYYYYNNIDNLNILNKWKCVYLQKVREERSNNDVVYYRVWFSPLPHGIESYRKFNRILHSTEGIITSSIDLSNHNAELLHMPRIYRTPRTNQESAARCIVDKYNRDSNRNIKFILYGSRGVGKTYTSVVVKRKLDNKGFNAKLFEDFDPSAVGVSINKLILPKATDITPVIIVINEIDVMFEKILNEPPSFDSRIQHTKDKSTFNNMMDSIGNTPNVILIGTTEKSYDELTSERYRSFVRRGRIDYFMKMTNKGINTSINTIGG